MEKKTPTMDLQGKEYATVPARLKEFREANPKGEIVTNYELLEDGRAVFTAVIRKDSSDMESASATGHAMGDLKNQKSFEKLETISVGRSLAMLGYLASGQIASSEEMESFNEWKETQADEAIGRMKQAETLEELKTIFMSLGSLMANKRVIEEKDKQKAELSKPKKEVSK